MIIVEFLIDDLTNNFAFDNEKELNNFISKLPGEFIVNQITNLSKKFAENDGFIYEVLLKTDESKFFALNKDLKREVKNMIQNRIFDYEIIIYTKIDFLLN